MLAKVTLGEADAGIVYSSDVTGTQRDQVQLIAIPAAVNVVATYPIALVADSAAGIGAGLCRLCGGSDGPGDPGEVRF